jgi:hypothetical protein
MAGKDKLTINLTTVVLTAILIAVIALVIAVEKLVALKTEEVKLQKKSNKQKAT